MPIRFKKICLDPKARNLILVGIVALIATFMGCYHRPPLPPPEIALPLTPTPTTAEFGATAYSLHGKTASGKTARRGMVAADPLVLPIGSRIRVQNAGQYSGEYVVTDTGRKINGHRIDIYVERESQARRFGRRQVLVEVLEYGDGRSSQRRRAVE